MRLEIRPPFKLYWKQLGKPIGSAAAILCGIHSVSGVPGGFMDVGSCEL